MNYNDLLKKYKHLDDLYNQLLKDYDEEMQKNIKALEYIEKLQNEYNESSVNESNIYLFSAYLHGVSKLIEIKEILKGDNNE